MPPSTLSPLIPYPSAVADTVVVGEGAGNVYYQREQPKVLNTAPRADFIYRDVLQRFEEIVLLSNSAMSRLVLNHLLKYHRLLKSTMTKHLTGVPPVRTTHARVKL